MPNYILKKTALGLKRGSIFYPSKDGTVYLHCIGVWGNERDYVKVPTSLVNTHPDWFEVQHA